MGVTMQTIKMDGLADVITGILAGVDRASALAMAKAVDKTAADIAKITRERAPVRKRGRSHGYNKTWTQRVGKVSSMTYQRVVYSKKPSLPHLLQWGHDGPVPARAIPHIPEDPESAEIFQANLEAELNKEL